MGSCVVSGHGLLVVMELFAIMVVIVSMTTIEARIRQHEQSSRACRAS